MIEKHYNGGLTREQFLFFEIRIVSSLVLQGKSRNEIEQEIFSENLFQFPTEKMIKNITKTCLKRIDALNAPELVYHLANASLDVAKQINLYAIMCENRIVYDFLTEVIGEKYRSQDFTFSSKDVAIFFMELSEKVPAVHTWSASTLKKLKQVLVRFLIECDYLENTRSQNLLPVYLYPELEEVIRVAQAKEFIDQKEERFDMEISQGGTNVSGGQKQRIGIAQALLKKVNIVIFDEATSALDAENNKDINEAIETLLKNKTLLYISHKIQSNENINAKEIFIK